MPAAALICFELPRSYGAGALVSSAGAPAFVEGNVKVVAGVNYWESGAELARRLAEGTAFARRVFPDDEKWRNRIEQVAVGTSAKTWEVFRTLCRSHIEAVVESMIKDGFPGDEPIEHSIRVIP